MISYKELIYKYQKENKKTEFDIERAINDLVGNSVLSANAVQQIRTDILKIFNEYLKLYKKHHYKIDRLEKHETSFLNRNFTFHVNVSFSWLKYKGTQNMIRQRPKEMTRIYISEKLRINENCSKKCFFFC